MKSIVFAVVIFGCLPFLTGCVSLVQKLPEGRKLEGVEIDAAFVRGSDLKVLDRLLTRPTGDPRFLAQDVYLVGTCTIDRHGERGGTPCYLAAELTFPGISERREKVVILGGPLRKGTVYFVVRLGWLSGKGDPSGDRKRDRMSVLKSKPKLRISEVILK